MKSFSRHDLDECSFEEELALDKRRVGANSLAVPREGKEHL